ncbi:MAG: hypothetical protein Q4E42_05630 [Phascolarctobacterium sp.]|nr:hypothetical protein [Phascolarctobacterium sp.]
MTKKQTKEIPQIGITDYVAEKLVHIFLQQCRDPKFQEEYRQWRKEKGLPDKPLFVKKNKNDQ